MSTRILGLDPGTAITGFGIIDADEDCLKAVEYGVIATPATHPLSERLRSIYEQCNALLKTYRPDAAAVEEVFFGRNITTAISVGQARGVLLLALAQAAIPVHEYSPPKIKEAVAGYGKADKAQIQLMVRQLLELSETPQPDDAADGLAVAITHYLYTRVDRLIDSDDRHA